MVKNICQNKYHISYLLIVEPQEFYFYMCSFFYLLSRSIMSDYFPSELMDIEGEAKCAVAVQPVTAEGEKGAGVDIKRTSIHPEVDNLLDSNKGEHTDDLEK